MADRELELLKDWINQILRALGAQPIEWADEGEDG